MNNIDVVTLNGCWAKIKAANGSELFTKHFYQEFFTEHPQLRALFPKDLQEQEVKLHFTLDNFINWFESLESLDTQLGALGRHHKAHSIPAEMYDLFINSLMKSAKVSSNNTLSDHELDTLEQAFRIIADKMLSAY